MSFYGYSFSYDGISCEELGLMLYDFNTTTQGNSSYAKGVEIQEDRIPRRHRSMYYGSYYKSGLEFTLVFGVKSNQEPIDRELMQVVAMWLTGIGGYRKLSIDQPDMRDYYYNCILTDLKMVEYAGDKWAFTCNAVCDSPYGYTYPREYKIDSSDGNARQVIFSESSCLDPYYPKLKITNNGATEISIINHSDNDRTFTLKDLTESDGTIDIDGETGILKSSSGVNIYSKCNFKFPRVYPGDNDLEIIGDCTVDITCEFPVNIGG